MPTYTFDHWEVNGVTYTAVPLNIIITADTTIMALYIEKGIPIVQAGFPIWIIPVSLALAGIAVYLATKKK